MADTKRDLPLSSGVDTLIARLRSEGVDAGEREADTIVQNARAQAEEILASARAESEAHLTTARNEADAYRHAGEEALKTAMRDAVLDMKTRLMTQFSADVKRLVSHHLEDPELIKTMIVEIAGRVRDGARLNDDDEIDIILPENVVGLADLRDKPQELQHGRLTELVLGLTGDMLRKGVGFRTRPDGTKGIRVEVKDRDIELDLTEEAVAGLLLQHLQPRFRAILEGIVK